MKKLTGYLFIVFLFSYCKTTSQHGTWCQSQCNAAGDEKANTELVEKIRENIDPDDESFGSEVLTFPLRVSMVTDQVEPIFVDIKLIEKTVDILNEGFASSFIKFDLVEIDTVYSPLLISDLSKDGYRPYRQFSLVHDRPDIITLFLFDYDKDLCRKEGSTISCSRSGGFSYVLSRSANNVVMSKFELADHKVVVHEFGHFFGLYHTFEEFQFGKEKADGSNCGVAGDRFCDTPADPGNIYEVHVNYSMCEMIGNTDPETGAEYKPMLNNYMAYYRPCYLRKYEFTPMQLAFIYTSSRSELRRKFAKE